MRRIAADPLLVFLVSAVLACAPAAPPATTPGPAPAVPAAPPAAAIPDTLRVREAPANWHLLDPEQDRLPGISAERAYRELLAGRQPARTVVVAVIDGGIDTSHADLRANLWINPGESGGTGRDDDGNGYADDLRGWNFIGGADGQNVRWDTFEVTRLFVRCSQVRIDTLPPEIRTRCPQIATDYDRRRTEAEMTLRNVQAADQVLSQATAFLRRQLGTDTLTEAQVEAYRPTTNQGRQARQQYLQLAAVGITPEVVAEAREAYEGQLRYAFNTNFDPRHIVGDDYANTAERHYGNSDVTGPDAKHGTHVAGIIGAVRGNDAGIDGIAPAVRIMALRAVPDGDERDKDVANAIRYAVDNGAQIINMSFGKPYSPEKAAVDAAVRYADERGVLLIHAAGNEGLNLAENESFPTARYVGNGRAANWIEVGATSWRSLDSLAASFTNYGAEQVDVFAPGVDILSTAPGGGVERQSGTSMAAPVVTGVAALLMSYYPELTAADVRRIIVASARSFAAQQVARPGDGEGAVAFGTLSVTGGIVNVYDAIRMAEEMRARR